MIFSTKKYLALILVIFLFGGIMQVKGQATMGAPVIRCVAVDSAGDVTIIWTNPANCNSTFQSYDLFEKGNLTPIATTTFSATVSENIPVAALSTSPNSNRIYFYITAVTSNGDTTSADTVSSIFLTATNLGTGVALLQWNAVHTPLLPPSSKWYKVYREDPYNYTWSFVDSTQNLDYYDTVQYCKSVKLNYKIEIEDSDCISISNISQTSLISEVIDPPQAILDTVSVTPAGNTVDISWSKSPKNNVIGYIIYEEFSPVTQPIDTVYGINNTSLSNFYQGPHPASDSAIGNPSKSSLTFFVSYLDSCGNHGPISNMQATLFLKQKPDRCEQTNTLNWAAYQNLVGGVRGYHIYFSTNGGATYNLLATTGRGTTTYIDSNLNTTQTRCYYVQVFDSALHDTTASSNIVCYNVSTALKPQYDYLRDASVVNNFSEVAVNAYIDTSSNVLGVYAGAGFYVLQRSIDSTGGYKSIDSVAANHHNKNVSFLDNTANPNQHSYHYQIITQDSCYHPIDTTNLGQTMLLTAAGQPNETNILTWNSYSDWYSGVYLYTIYRSEDGINFMNIDNYSPTINAVNTYTDNVKSITTGQGTFYYYIMAVEHASPFPFIDTSYSNLAQAYQDPIVYIPDAFNPKGVNRVFIPVGVFIDVTGYDFVILNRWGIVIFESKDPTVGWNGNGTNGKEEEEGVYVYLLTYTSSKGEYFQRKGTVTLLK